MRERLRQLLDRAPDASVGEGDLTELFRRRAERLAAGRSAPSVEAHGTWALIAHAGAGRYALKLTDLAEVLPLPRWSPVPGWPPGLLGVAARRGVPVPVVDLHLLLGHPPPVAGALFHMLLLRAPAPAYALRVDGLGGTQRIDTDRFTPTGTTPAGPTGRTGLIAGVDPDGLVLLDPGRLARPDALLG